MNDWERLNNGFDPNLVGNPKISLNLRYEGTFEGFVNWVQETFKHPEQLPIRVTVQIGEGEEAKPVDTWYQTFLTAFPQCRPNPHLREQINEVREKIVQGQKIEAIKALRAFTGASLMEGKDFVERHVGISPR